MHNDCLPCPFCAHEQTAPLGLDNGVWIVGCPVCGCMGPEAANDADAVRQWNMRETAQSIFEATL